mmetsp:Transcript_18055/g.33350  ORF Transcript_18055/g.33350 Transcript_18055/m.33350 type:complete len:223 (+) Transcript_18055:223-891(+)
MMSLNLLHNLHHVFILENVRNSDPLRLVLCTCPPHQSVLELISERSMDSITKVANSRGFVMKNYGCVVIWDLALRFCVNTNHFGIVPNVLQELVKVPLIFGTDRNVMRDLVKEVEFLNRDSINLVEHIDTRHVDNVSFDNIDEVIYGAVLTQYDVSVVNLVLSEDHLNGFQIQVGGLFFHGAGKVDASLILLSKEHTRGVLVESNIEPIELLFNQFLVCYWL